MIAEQKSDTEIRYVYIKKFSYYHPEVAESFSGHPRTGGIYRSLYHLHTKHHRLLLPDGIVLGFNQLVGNSGDAEFDLAEITKDNILDFNLSEEDLDVFLLPNNDIFFEPSMKVHEAIVRQEEIESDFAHRASEIIMGLWSINSIKAELLLDIAHCLTELEMTSHEDAANYLRLHPTKGMALNIGEALRALDRYAGDDRKSNEDTADLMVAIESCVTELERKFDQE